LNCLTVLFMNVILNYGLGTEGHHALRRAAHSIDPASDGCRCGPDLLSASENRAPRPQRNSQWNSRPRSRADVVPWSTSTRKSRCSPALARVRGLCHPEEL